MANSAIFILLWQLISGPYLIRYAICMGLETIQDRPINLTLLPETRVYRAPRWWRSALLFSGMICLLIALPLLWPYLNASSAQQLGLPLVSVSVFLLGLACVVMAYLSDSVKKVITFTHVGTEIVHIYAPGVRRHRYVAYTEYQGVEIRRTGARNDANGVYHIQLAHPGLGRDLLLAEHKSLKGLSEQQQAYATAFKLPMVRNGQLIQMQAPVKPVMSKRVLVNPRLRLADEQPVYPDETRELPPMPHEQRLKLRL